MCLRDLVCGSLRVIKFDVELVVAYLFRNIPLILILKCIVYYLGLSLIDILDSDMLSVA